MKDRVPHDVISVEPAALSADLVMFAHFTELYDRAGAVEMGRMADGVLAGVSAALASRIGPVAAYEMIQRCADEVAVRIAVESRS